MEELLQEILDLYGMDRELFFGKRKFLEVTTAKKHFIQRAMGEGHPSKVIQNFMGIDHHSIRYHKRNPRLGMTPEQARHSLPITLMAESGATIEEIFKAFPDRKELTRKTVRRSRARSKRNNSPIQKRLLDGEDLSRNRVKDAISRLGLRMGSMTSLLNESMTAEVRAYWISYCINNGYKSIEEVVADFMTDKYFEASA